MRRLCPRLSTWDVAGTVSSADVWSWAFNLDAAWSTWCWLMLISWMFPLGTEGWAPSWCRGRQHSIRCPKNLIVWHFFFWVILMISDSLGVWPFSEFSIWHRKLGCETHRGETHLAQLCTWREDLWVVGISMDLLAPVGYLGLLLVGLGRLSRGRSK